MTRANGRVKQNDHIPNDTCIGNILLTMMALIWSMSNIFHPNTPSPHPHSLPCGWSFCSHGNPEEAPPPSPPPSKCPQETEVTNTKQWLEPSAHFSPSEAICGVRAWFTLVQAIACCPTASRYYPAQFWLIIGEVLGIHLRAISQEMLRIRIRIRNSLFGLLAMNRHSIAYKE